jgi:hypothetical protein
MTGAWAQSRHNECTTPVARGTKSDARFVPACDYQDRFTEPPHRATEVKQQGQGPGSPILVPGNVTDRPTPGHTTTEATHPAPVAQWIEQAPSKRLAAGSSPAGGAQLYSTFLQFRHLSSPTDGPAFRSHVALSPAEGFRCSAWASPRQTHPSASSGGRASAPPLPQGHRGPPDARPRPLGPAARDALYVFVRLWLRRTRSASCSAPVAGLAGR